MGQGIGGIPEAPAVGARAREPIGRYIAQQRRLRGIDLEDLAARTRIPRRSLERLEAGAFDHSPDGFSRGFVRTVAEAIGLDPDDAVARMLPEAQPAREEPPRLAFPVAAAALIALLAGTIIAVREMIPARAPEPALAGEPSPNEHVRERRDYVRELAEAQGIDTERLTERAAVLPPLPAEEPAATEIADGSNPATQKTERPVEGTPPLAGEASGVAATPPTSSPVGGSPSAAADAVPRPARAPVPGPPRAELGPPEDPTAAAPDPAEAPMQAAPVPASALESEPAPPPARVDWAPTTSAEPSPEVEMDAEPSALFGEEPEAPGSPEADASEPASQTVASPGAAVAPASEDAVGPAIDEEDHD